MESADLVPNSWTVLPFGLLLAAIALGPLLFADWWAKNYAWVACVLALVPVTYYLFALRAPDRVLSVAHEYVSFIALIGLLFVVSGGIHINVKGSATPPGFSADDLHEIVQSP